MDGVLFIVLTFSKLVLYNFISYIFKQIAFIHSFIHYSPVERFQSTPLGLETFDVGEFCESEEVAHRIEKLRYRFVVRSFELHHVDTDVPR